MFSKWKVLYEKHAGSMAFSFFFNAVLFLLIFIIFRPINVTDDNLKILNICNGSYGSRDYRLIYVNCIFGGLLKAVYSIFPLLPWFDILSEVLIFISLSVLTYVLIHIMGSRLGLFCTLVLICFYGPQTYIRVQYTKTCGVVSVAGIALALYAVMLKDRGDGGAKDIGRKEILLGISGICLAAAGSFYRMQQFAAVAVLMAPVFLFLFIRGNRKKVIVIVLGMCALVFVSRVIDHYAYSSDEEWSYFMRFHESRVDLFDYGFPDYETNAEEMEKLGIKKSAYDLLRSYNYADPDVFTADVLEAMVNMRGEKDPISGTTVKEFLALFPFEFFAIPEFYVALIFLLTLFVYGKHDWLTVCAVFGETALFSGIYFFLFYQGRYLVERVDMGLLLAVSMTFAMLMIQSPEDHLNNAVSMKAVMLASGIVLIFSQSFFKENWRHYTNVNAGISDGQTSKIMEISNDEEHLYLCKRGYPDIIFAFEPFDAIPAGIFDNIYWLGGWQVFEPVTYTALDNYGISNPYRDMIGNDRVYLIDDDIDLTLRYIHDYYDPDAKAEEIRVIGNDYQVYQIVD